MSPSEFELLSTPEKEALVFAEGAFIMARQEPEFIIRLFQYGNFYVELYYHLVQDSPVCVKAFASDSRQIEVYLKLIDISALIH